MKNSKLIKNKNFKNNQNYIFWLSEKKLIIAYKYIKLIKEKHINNWKILFILLPLSIAIYNNLDIIISVNYKNEWTWIFFLILVFIMIYIFFMGININFNKKEKKYIVYKNTIKNYSFNNKKNIKNNFIFFKR